MIDFESFCGKANGASAVLPAMERFDIGDSECASVGGFARPAVRTPNSSEHSCSFRVFTLPARERSLYLFRMFGSVTAVNFWLFLRIGLSVFPLVLRFIVISGNFPFFTFAHRARKALAVGGESFVMAVLAWNPRGVMAITAFFSCDSVGVPWLFSHASKTVNGCASGARSSPRVTFGNMAVFARLTCKVKSFAGNFGGFTFRNWFAHPYLLSDTLMVSRTA